MRVVIAGGTGLIGQALSKSLLADRHDVVILTRRSPEAGPSMPGTRLVSWRPPSSGGWESELDGAEAVVNLAGASIAGESSSFDSVRPLDGSQQGRHPAKPGRRR